MKTYKKGEYIAWLSKHWDLYSIDVERDGDTSERIRVPMNFILAMGFEEIPEEPVQEIPDWFEKFLAGIWEVWDRYKPKKTLFVEYKYFDVGLLYKLFLKHYPQTEYLK